ncbi:transposase and inactivated derivative [Paenibacillus popilliae ATCC 14706]|uniref:Transposase and inactivated derivative n=2 Tax=Paenibacillus popilliae ATCC 14706 TaxID=1212764 RepID=M9LC50_PAEPP|nr:transposase and inactivated derivative [Paenibacillus popilliae ATCC 14706]
MSSFYTICTASEEKRKFFSGLELTMVIEEKLQATWFPEQIMERLRQEGQAIVCFKTIYRWLYAGHLMKGVLAVLRHKGKRQKPVETRGKFTVGKAIVCCRVDVLSFAAIAYAVKVAWFDME